MACELGATVAIVDREWFGGSCPHVGCLSSKSLLDGATRHHANPRRYDWAKASVERDFMINRLAGAAEPDDSTHVTGLTAAGAVVYRGTGAIARRGVVTVRHDRVTHELAATNVMVAAGSVSKRPAIEGLDDADPRAAESLVILGGGPTGCELAQVYVRFGVPTTIVQSGPRLAPTSTARGPEVRHLNGRPRRGIRAHNVAFEIVPPKWNDRLRLKARPAER